MGERPWHQSSRILFTRTKRIYETMDPFAKTIRKCPVCSPNVQNQDSALKHIHEEESDVVVDLRFASTPVDDGLQQEIGKGRAVEVCVLLNELGKRASPNCSSKAFLAS